MANIVPLDKQYPQPPPVPTTGGLGKKIIATLVNAFAQVRDTMTEWFEDRLINFGLKILKTYEIELTPLTRPIIDKLLATNKVPVELQPLLRELANPSGEALANAASGMVSQVAGSALTMALNAVLLPLAYELNSETQNVILSPESYAVLKLRRPELARTFNSLLNKLGYDQYSIDWMQELTHNFAQIQTVIQAMLRGYITEGVARDYLHKQGFQDEDIQIFIDASYMQLDPTVARTLYLRETWDARKHDDYLKHLGMRDEDIKALKQTYYYIPPPQDLITMAIREAFNDEQIKFLHLDAEFPDQFGIWAKRQGIEDIWAKRYWYAHWQLPSAEMGYEMLHRGLITPDELDKLLKALDYSPAWRNKLAKISYNPYTRVDVRRMYQTGVLKAKDLIKAYQDIGYDLEHASKLAEFTIKGASMAEKDLSRDDILTSYKDKLINRADAKQMLLNIGYDDHESELYLAKADYEVAKSEHNDKVELVHQRFINHVIDENEATQQLLAVPVYGDELETLMRKWRAQIATPDKTLTKEDIHTLYLTGVYDRSATLAKLRAIGYKDNDANALCLVWDGELAEKEAKSKIIKVKVPSVSEVRQLWEQDIIDQKKAAEYLADNNYTSETIAYLLQMWDKIRREREKAEQDREAAKLVKTPKLLTRSEVGDLYRNEVIDEARARSLLKDLNYRQEEIDLTIQRWNDLIAQRKAADEAAKRKEETVVPRELTRSQIGELYVKGIITEGSARDLLAQLNYVQTDIDNTIALWNKQLGGA